MTTLFSHLANLPDPRTPINIRHNLLDVVFLVFSAVLSGASGWKAIEVFGDAQLAWLRQYRSFEHGIPRRHCIANILRALDGEALMQALLEWINSRRQQAGQAVIAIDGKTLRSAWNKESCQALHVVSAYDVEAGITLCQQAATSKGQERELARKIIDMLALEQCIVTLDALHCQPETLARIVARKGDFVVQLKANQPQLARWVEQAFASAREQTHPAYHETLEQGHGRRERRSVLQIPAALPPELAARWPHVRSLIEVSSERSQDGRTCSDARWFVSSLPLDVKLAAHAVRRHWGIENELHWVLDVVFREDELQVADPDGAAQLALFNRVALSVIRQYTKHKDSVNGKRQRAAWDPSFRSKVLFD